MAKKSDLLLIPGIGNTFARDFSRIDVQCINDLVDKDAETLYQQLCEANEAVGHKTSTNYLYVIRMAIYYANGGRNKVKLKWNAWKD